MGGAIFGKAVARDVVSGRISAAWIRGAVLVVAIAAWSLSFLPSPVMAQIDLRNDRIKFDYYEPRDPKLVPLYERLQRRQVLEELSQFLAPVRWPKTLRLIMKEC